jgi:acetyltransferase-like isoleucine patch superfamily enzyme
MKFFFLKSKAPTKDKKAPLPVDEAEQIERFHTEDFEFKGVPVGRMTYGYKGLSDRSMRGTRSIGRFCSIATSVSVVGMTHPLEWVSTNPFLYLTSRGFTKEPVPLPAAAKARNKRVIIGHDVWIGEGALILRPNRLGHGCVVAAGAVVTKDVPPYAIVAGTPAKIIRYRVPEELIPDLLAIAWWNWPLEKIKEHMPNFYDPARFVETFRVQPRELVTPA